MKIPYPVTEVERQYFRLLKPTGTICIHYVKCKKSQDVEDPPKKLARRDKEGRGVKEQGDMLISYVCI